MQAHSITTLKPSQVTAFLEDQYHAGNDTWVHGSPGIGKTQLVEQLAQKLKVNILIHPPAASLEPPDVSGGYWPDPKKKGMVRLPNLDLWPQDPEWEGILFVDELGQADPDIQKAYMQCCCSRRVGSQEIPKGVRFIATGNRKQDRAGVKSTLTPLLNRFGHVDLVVDLADWQAWAVEAGIDPSVRAFLNFRPALLNAFDPAREERSFPTPRSWHKVSRGIPHMRESLVQAHVAAFVGDSAAVEFLAFRQIYQNLPDPDSLLANPTGCTLPDITKGGGPAIYYALTAALVERVRADGPRVAPAFVALVDRFPKEFSMLAMLDAKRIFPQVTNSPRGQDWLRTHREVLVS